MRVESIQGSGRIQCPLQFWKDRASEFLVLADTSTAPMLCMLFVLILLFLCIISLAFHLIFGPRAASLLLNWLTDWLTLPEGYSVYQSLTFYPQATQSLMPDRKSLPNCRLHRTVITRSLSVMHLLNNDCGRHGSNWLHFDCWLRT